MARPKSITVAQESFITAATAAKMSSREIAAQLNISHTSVQRFQRASGIKKPKAPALIYGDHNV